MSYNLVKEANLSPIKIWNKFVPVETQAMNQLKNLATLPFIHEHIAVMPDCHWGMGATIGSVIATVGAVIPAAVGVDIGCGMTARRISLTASDLPDNLLMLRTYIEERVPHGRTDDGGSNDVGSWRGRDPLNLTDERKAQIRELGIRLQPIVDKHPTLRKAAERAFTQCGTLGTGNHFIEVCLDENDGVWLVLHSGSRGVGNAIGRYFISKAKEEMIKDNITLPDIDLAYLAEHGSYFLDYVEAVEWAQDYAALNRAIMMDAVIVSMHKFIEKPFTGDVMAINCHHNYISREFHYGKDVIVTRKGAVKAGMEDLGIIPGSMGAKTFIVRGKGNPESFQSCSHGAGRIMSRTQAKKLVSLEEHIQDTAGVECKKDLSVIDETPKAYKNIDDVMKSQDDLVEVLFILKQIVCVKG